MQNEDIEEHAGDGDAPVSKSQRKREMLELQALGKRLTALNNKQLESLDLPEDLFQALRETRTITKNGALRRHMQYIGRLMRSVDPAPIRDKVGEWDGVSLTATAEQHQLERWRMRLMDDEGALAEYIAFQQARGRTVDIQQLRALIRNARDERERGKAPRYFRELFRELKRLADDGGSASRNAGDTDETDQP